MHEEWVQGIMKVRNREPKLSQRKSSGESDIWVLKNEWEQVKVRKGGGSGRNHF